MVRNAGPSKPPRLGSHRQIEAPTDGDFDRAGVWRIFLHGSVPAQVSEVFLGIDYAGDVARIYVQDRFVADDFNYGRLWEPGLRRMDPASLEQGMELRVLPLRKDSQIYLDSKARPDFDAKGEAIGLRSVRVMPEYEVSLGMGSLAGI